MVKRVADIIIETLVEQGVVDCFAVVGGGAMHLDNALALNKSINKYFNHHEQACAMAAEANARISGNIAAVCVTSGPGATNTLTGVMGCWQDSLPMIVLSGQVRYEISVSKSGLPLRYRGIQEYEIVPCVKHMTKYAIMITDPLMIKREIKKAIQISLEGRRGPVWLDIPLDIQSAMVEEDELYPYEEKQYDEPVINFKKIQEVLNNSERPCILAGSGIRSAHVMEEFVSFIEKLGVPVIGGAWVADNMYREHPLFFGLSGNIGPRTGNFILQNADLIVVLGNSLGFRQTGFNQSGFAPNAKIIMIDVDENESKKPGLHLDMYIKADLHDFLHKAISEMEHVNVADDWVQYCNHLRNRFDVFEGADNITMEERVSSYYFWKVFEQYEPDDSILALGNNTGNTAKLQIGVRKKDQRVVTNYTCGSMGYDLPAAIGAAVSSGKRVFCVTGDGSVMMNLQELQTIRHYGLPIHVIIFSNDGYGAIRQTSKNFFNGIYIGCTKDTGISFPEFSDVAKTFGFQYMLCEKNEDIDKTLQALFASEENVLLEIKQRFDDPVTPKVMSRMNDDGSFSTPSLEDMAPFLSKEEHDSLMF